MLHTSWLQRLPTYHVQLLCFREKEKTLKLLSLPACPVQEFMSLIGLPTATEKQVHLGRLHMRPINWRVPESLEKVIPIPRSLHPHLQWWLKEDNVQANHYTQ